MFAALRSLASTEDSNWDFSFESCNSFLSIFWFSLLVNALFFCWALNLRFFTAVIFSWCNFSILWCSILQEEHLEICLVFIGDVGIGKPLTVTASSTSISSHYATDGTEVHVITFGLPQGNFSWQMKSNISNSLWSDSFLNLFKVLSTTF